MTLHPDDCATVGHPPAELDLVAYAEGSLDRVGQEAVEAHLGGCGWCSEAVDELRSTLLLLEVADLRPAGGSGEGIDERSDDRL